MQVHTSAGRPSSLVFALALVALSASIGYAHTYLGLEQPALVRARVQSPNAAVTDLPIPIPGTGLSIVCFKVRNTSPDDSRITAIGFDLPGSPTGFTLVSPTDGEFHLIEQTSQVPQLPDVTLDFALVTGRTFGGGRPHSGLPPGDTLTTFCVSGPFPDEEDPSNPPARRPVSIERLLDLGVLRVQRVGPDGEGGDVAVWSERPR